MRGCHCTIGVECCTANWPAIVATCRDKVPAVSYAAQGHSSPEIGMKVLSLCVVLVTGCAALPRPGRPHLPLLPPGLSHLLQPEPDTESALNFQQSPLHYSLAARYPAQALRTPVSHFPEDERYAPHHNGSFDMRYWFDARYSGAQRPHLRMRSSSQSQSQPDRSISSSAGRRVAPTACRSSRRVSCPSLPSPPAVFLSSLNIASTASRS
jgi:hypothetical protein